MGKGSYAVKSKNVPRAGPSMASRVFSQSVSTCKHLEIAAYSKKEMAPHSSTRAWRVPWAEEPGGLQSTGSLRVGLSDFTFSFHFHALEKEMATRPSVLAWRIPGTGAWWAAVYGVAQSRT